MNSWDDSFLNTADPDQLAVMKLEVHCNPDFPLPLAVVECAADLPIDIRIARREPEIEGFVAYDLSFTGKCMDLAMMNFKVNDWSNRVPVQRNSVEEVLNARAAADSKEGNSGEPDPGSE